MSVQESLRTSRGNRVHHTEFRCAYLKSRPTSCDEKRSKPVRELKTEMELREVIPKGTQQCLEYMFGGQVPNIQRCLKYPHNKLTLKYGNTI